MTIPTATDSHQEARPALALVPNQDDAELYLSAEEESELCAARPLPGCTIKLRTSPFYTGAQFDDVREFLPMRGHFVYILLDEWKNPLYVGQTRHPRNRLRNHWASQPWIAEVASIELIQTVDEVTARDVERMHTDRRRPRYSQVTRSERIMLDRRLADAEAAANGKAL